MTFDIDIWNVGSSGRYLGQVRSTVKVIVKVQGHGRIRRRKIFSAMQKCMHARRRSSPRRQMLSPSGETKVRSAEKQTSIENVNKSRSGRWDID